MSLSKKWFAILSGTGADGFNATFQSTNSKIKFALERTDHSLGYWLWLMNYADAYGSRLSRNGNRMAELIDSLPNQNAFVTRLDALTDDATILSGIENATGESYAAAMDGTTKLQRSFNDLIIVRKSDREKFCSPCEPVGGKAMNHSLWGTFTGGSQDRGRIGRYSGYELSNFGIAFGLERKLSNRWLGGVAFGYDNATLKLDRRFSKDEFEAFHASLYGAYTGRNWYASGYLGYSKNWHDVKRDNIALGFHNRGQYDDDLFSTGLEVGKILKLQNGARFMPSIGIHWIHLDSPTFTEHGMGMHPL